MTTKQLLCQFIEDSAYKRLKDKGLRIEALCAMNEITHTCISFCVLTYFILTCVIVPILTSRIGVRIYKW
ncbi:MAG: hypothetical protein U0Y10_07730 [Spirosomataceae bacterium]